jgi:hypothetical protein
MKKTLTFNVVSPADYEAGIRGHEDTVTVSCESGDFTGDPEGEDSFQEAFQQFLMEWYDGASVKQVVPQEACRECGCGVCQSQARNRWEL